MKISPVQASERCSIRLLVGGGVSAQGVCLPGECLPRGYLPRGVFVCWGCLHAGGGGGLSAWGMSARGGLPRGLSAQGGCLPCEVSAQRYLPGKWGVCLGRGVSAWGGGVWQTPPMDIITDACENITLPQLCCGR